MPRPRAASRSPRRICCACSLAPIRARASSSTPRSRRTDRPRAEDRRAYADMGGAEADGDVVVAAHAHAEPGEAVAARDFPQQREVQRRLLLRWRDAHEPSDGKAEAGAALLDETVGL